MNDILTFAASEIRRFLGSALPLLGPNWWQLQVVDRLSFQQQRAVTERGSLSLDDLDLAALLRVLDQNWYEISQKATFPREARSWVRELQVVRNKWSHVSARPVPASETYRDVDTTGRVLGAIGTIKGLDLIETRKAELLLELAPKTLQPAITPGASSRPTTFFVAGELVALRSNPSTILPVLEVLVDGGEPRYRVFENGAKVTYYESQLQADSPSEGMPTLSAAEVRAYLTSLHLAPPSSAHLYSLRSGRITFVPYQYRPVLKLIRADRPRLLIGDEVGVGKTIEAALILKELRARTDLSSVLVICPKALVAEKKWYRELKRFDEHFATLDGPALRHCVDETDKDGTWPDQYARSILPMSLLDQELLHGRAEKGRRRRKGLLDLDPPPKFDLVIVDEAHHIRNPDTFVHQAVRYFCDNAEAVVFLTATPVQLGSVDLYTLLNTLRPDLIIDQASYQRMAEPNSSLHRAVHECRMAEPGWTSRVRDLLDGAAQTEWGRMFLREHPGFQGVYDDVAESEVPDVTRVSLIRRIEELGTFSGLINRTRRRDIDTFTTRKADAVRVPFTPSQQAFHDSLLEVIARILAARHGDLNVKFMMTTIRRQAASCLFGLVPLLNGILGRTVDRIEILEADDDTEVDFNVVEILRDEISALRDLASTLDRVDLKLEAFIRSIRDKQRLAKNKALVFSTFRHTLKYLADALSAEGLRFGLVHGDIPDEERAELRRRFALSPADEDAIDVLLSSEVGSEGLDFQFCDFLINYDLPWNPMKIEQRIGRLDRYGQESESVVILNFITPGTVDAEIYDRCLWRIGVFQQAIGGNEEILGELTTRLHDIAERFDLTPEERVRQLAQLADNEIRIVQEQQELEVKQAELFGLAVQGWQKDIAAAETPWLAPPAIESLVSTYLAVRLGATHDVLLGEGAQKTLRLSQEARSSLAADAGRLSRTADDAARDWDRWLKGSSPNLAVTFEQGMAAQHPRIAHLSLTHPLVRHAASYFSRVEPAETHLMVRHSAAQASHYRFAIYRWALRGVRSDERLIVVTDAPELDDELLSLLLRAEDEPGVTKPNEYVDLDKLHYAKWSKARANHSDENRQHVEYRLRSLQASHAARRKILEDQIARATNEKIQIMKDSQLRSADADFDRHLADLDRAASAGDIIATPVLFGTITVRDDP